MFRDFITKTFGGWKEESTGTNVYYLYGSRAGVVFKRPDAPGFAFYLYLPAGFAGSVDAIGDVVAEAMRCK